jgi:cell division septal protein FtsQ
MRRRVVLGLALIAILAIGVYWFGLRGSSTTDAEARQIHPVAQIGEGKTVILVGDNGALLGNAAGKKKSHLPVLPLKAPPKGNHVRGGVLEQVHLLAAAPKQLRHLVAATGHDKTGVTATFTSGIEVRFGDEREATRKWEAAAAVLADPSVKLLSYVDVTAPTRPVYGGDEHELPAAK